MGAVTARDEWAYDFNSNDLREKVVEFMNVYEAEKVRWRKAGKPKKISDFVDRRIKWTSELETHLQRDTLLEFEESRITLSLYRPFVSMPTYFAGPFTHRTYQLPALFPESAKRNPCITFLSISSSWLLTTLATDRVFDYCLLKQGNGGTQALPLYIFDESGHRTDNITDWGVKQFEKRYGKRAKLSRERIFAYVYAVLHNPAYREKYALNLKRELPRVPLYDGFAQWADWGEKLMALHIGFESAGIYPLTRTDVAGSENPKCKLKADKDAGRIVVDEATTLSGVPEAAWDYKLGNRSALEWVLDQYKESAPRDPTIREHFNTYRFADYKERVIELLCRVCTVSVETQKIIHLMP
ncbi:MAG: type ISP restriction/modification enzyme [Stenotrophobium sp.]